MTETIDKEIKQLKERIEILEEQKKQLNWEDKCFKVIENYKIFFIRTHKLTEMTNANVNIICDCISYEINALTDRKFHFQFLFEIELTIPKHTLIPISLKGYRQSINKIYNDLNKQI